MALYSRHVAHASGARTMEGVVPKMSQHCSNCSASEYLAERVDAYKSATSLLKDAGIEFTPEDLLMVAAFLTGDVTSG